MSMLSDARFALRTLGRQPRFTLAAILALAFGIGANTVTFGFLQGARAYGYPPPPAGIAVPEINPWLLAALLGGTQLLICAHVAQLLLARNASRRRELALRSALGASRRRLMRQLLTESVILALSGGAAGLLLAAWAVHLLPALAPPGLGGPPRIQLNGRAVLFAAVLALATGYVCGLLPAWRATPRSLGDRLGTGGPAATAAARGRRRRPRRGLVKGEVALALALLAGAALALKNFYLLMAIDPGFAPHRAVLTASVRLPAAAGRRAAGRDAQPARRDDRATGRDAQAAFFQRLVERAARLPSVESAAATSSLPGESANWLSFSMAGSVPAPGWTRSEAEVIQVTPDCFHVLGVPVRRGRQFSAHDAHDADNAGDSRAGWSGPLPPAIVNQEFVRDFSAGEEPLGRRLVFPSLPGPAAWRIVGVVGDVRQDGMELTVPPIVYLPYSQGAPPDLTGPGVSMGLLLRAASGQDAASLAAPLRQALAAIDPELALADPRTAAELFDRMVAGRRLELLLMTLFAGVFLVLAALGIYSAISWSLAQRSREIAIRVAVGAHGPAVLREVVREGVSLAALGTSIGLGIFVFFRLGLTLCEENRLPWYDPALVALASLLMVALGALVSWLPAARAVRLDLAAELRDG